MAALVVQFLEQSRARGVTVHPIVELDHAASRLGVNTRRDRAVYDALALDGIQLNSDVRVVRLEQAKRGRGGVPPAIMADGTPLC